MASEPGPVRLLTIESSLLKEAALSFRAIDHPFRQRILALLHDHEQLMVKDIFVKLRSDQSKTSVHLGILRRANLVIAKREGKVVYYRVHYAQIGRIHRLAEDLLTTTSL